ncbi:16S rRNA (guanine(966)-N(2))-methyltransferase RsmD [Orenia marismortui]|uniref:16S rRNA (Guanine966-N2)-methyltransferase n=1 Tax=Orenia marismortui TaxID=46469 RepID=A0A4R8HA56_9FIRM|nr:16S rRNA (guanine(966)-N(2))-methyltransferase RsmD [Orenia marismortui]TDX52188.1 16S rRNA (guanine966-N2)-methyltransferase [Orenia marismortui]
MRIIAGKDKGRRLKSLKRRDVRPTTDRTKESIFNILGPNIAGTRFLDLYSGFGGIGIEALSRGAKEVVFVEKDRRNIKVIKDNLNLVDYEKISQIINNDVLRALPILNGEFDLIFMDPPYEETELYTNTLNKIKSYNLLSDKGIIIIEYDAKDKIEIPEGYSIIKEKRYGKAGIILVKEIKGKDE